MTNEIKYNGTYTHTGYFLYVGDTGYIGGNDSLYSIISCKFPMNVNSIQLPAGLYHYSITNEFINFIKSDCQNNIVYKDTLKIPVHFSHTLCITDYSAYERASFTILSSPEDILMCPKSILQFVKEHNFQISDDMYSFLHANKRNAIGADFLDESLSNILLLLPNSAWATHIMTSTHNSVDNVFLSDSTIAFNCITDSIILTKAYNENGICGFKITF